MSAGSQPSGPPRASRDTVKAQLLFSLSCIHAFAALWTVALQAPPFMGFSRQESWSGLPFPSPGGLRRTRIEPVSPALAGGFVSTEPAGKPVGRPCSHTYKRGPCPPVPPGLSEPPEPAFFRLLRMCTHAHEGGVHTRSASATKHEDANDTHPPV